MKKKHQILAKYQDEIGHGQTFYTVVCTERISGLAGK
jgi:1,2-phenylacetyl-CoA epoxidase catalytic subunit